MRSRGYRRRSEGVIEFLLIVVAIAILVWGLLGCATTAGREEPEWEPHLYIRSVGPACKFIDAFGDHIACEDVKRLDRYVLLPFTNLGTLKTKLQRCERWK